MWTGSGGLTLRLTTDDNFLFLECNEELRPRLKPFMDLTETKATWHPEAKGWLLPVNLFPGINRFLETVHEVISTVPAEEDRTRSVATPGRATMHWLGHGDKLLLQMLTQPDVTKDSDLEELDEGPIQRVHVVSGRAQLIKDAKMEARVLARLDLERHFLVNAGFTIQAGDLLKYTYTTDDENFNDNVYIYDGKRFIPLLTGILNVAIIPEQFKCPAPFPIMYWSAEHSSDTLRVGAAGRPFRQGLLHNESGYSGDEGPPQVYFNVAQFEAELKYNPNPPPLAVPEAWSEYYLDAGEDQLFAAMEFTYKGTLYRLYCYGKDSAAISEEACLARIHQGERCAGWTDTALII